MHHVGLVNVWEQADLDHRGLWNRSARKFAVFFTDPCHNFPCFTRITSTIHLSFFPRFSVSICLIISACFPSWVVTDCFTDILAGFQWLKQLPFYSKLGPRTLRSKWACVVQSHKQSQRFVKSTNGHEFKEAKKHRVGGVPQLGRLCVTNSQR